MKAPVVVMALAAVGSLVACGPAAEIETAYLGHPIIYGEPDNNPAHDAVVGLRIVNGAYMYMCTGTLISPEVVLTAAHCLADQSLSSITVVFGRTIYSTNRRSVAQTWIHPGYVPISSNQPPLNDIAMAKMSQAVATPAPILPLPHHLGLTYEDVGTSLQYVGYGVTETDSAGTKLTMMNELDILCTNPSGCGAYNPANANQFCTDMRNEEPGTCQGDSGGPALIVRGETEYVAGITSWGDQHCDILGCSNLVDVYEDEINEFAGGYTGSACTGSDECNSGYCTDGVCCETACDAGCKSCNLVGSLGLCRTVPNGTGCQDNDLCNGDEVCLQGECVVGPDLDCDDGDPCSQDLCDATTGCVHQPVADDSPCPNDTICDGEEVCQGGQCVPGVVLDCNDANPCTRDACDPASGCTQEPEPDGASCGGGSCGEGTCDQGVCLAADEQICDDLDPCTQDWCDPDSGCVHSAFPRGYECGSCKACLEGACVELRDCDQSGCGCGRHPGNDSLQLMGLFFFLLVLLRRR